jgi:hypothetical protein
MWRSISATSRHLASSILLNRIASARLKLTSAREVLELVAGPQRVDDRDPDVRLVERRVVVAAVPDDHVGLFFGLAEDRLEVDTGEDDVARLDVVFVFFALLDRALVLIEVLHGVVALHALGDEITVGHRVPHNGDAQVLGAEQFADLAGRLALAAARADGADGDDGLLRLDHRRVDVEGAELDARALDQLPLLVDIAVADVAVGEDGFVDLLVLQEVDELLFGMDRDAIRVELPRDRRRIAAVVDEGDLGRRERNDFDVGVVPVAGVEEVKVSACGAEDQDSRSRHGALVSTVSVSASPPVPLARPGERVS